MIEKRALQTVVAVACLLPLLVGGASVVHGPAIFGHPADLPRDLDSQFRYVSGIFFALGLGFVSCIPSIERKGPRFRLLGALVVVGGLSRAVSLAAFGAPSAGHLLGLAMEVLVVPLLLLWQANLAARLNQPR